MEPNNTPNNTNIPSTNPATNPVVNGYKPVSISGGSTINKTRVVLTALLILLVAIGGYLWLTKGTYHPKFTTEVGEKQKVLVERSQPIDGDTVDLPTEFPAGIPVEADNVFESYKSDYQGKHVMQYTVSYTSSKSADELWTIYDKYMKSAKYDTANPATSKDKGTIYGLLDNKGLAVTIASNGDKTNTVRLNYFVR
jgi:hypothetical protein